MYSGHIEIIAVIDGASVNKHTYQAALECQQMVSRYPQRHLVILPKWQRGGRVSSLNAALNIAKGELFFALDGDTSFDPNSSPKCDTLQFKRLASFLQKPWLAA